MFQRPPVMHVPTAYSQETYFSSDFWIIISGARCSVVGWSTILLFICHLSAVFYGCEMRFLTLRDRREQDADEHIWIYGWENGKRLQNYAQWGTSYFSLFTKNHEGAQMKKDYMSGTCRNQGIGWKLIKNLVGTFKRKKLFERHRRRWKYY